MSKKIDIKFDVSFTGCSTFGVQNSTQNIFYCMQTHSTLKIGATLLILTGVVLGSCSKGSDATPATTTPAKQLLGKIVLTPSAVTLPIGGSQQFTAQGQEYDGTPLAYAIYPTWSANGGGTISSTGLFTATTAGNYTVTANDHSVLGTAMVTVAAPTPSSAHRITFKYINSGLYVPYSFEAGIRVTVDRAPQLLGVANDSTFYISANDSRGEITFPKNFNTPVGAKVLRFEIGFYNIFGTSANPLTSSNAPLIFYPNVRLGLTPVVDGKDLTGVGQYIDLRSSSTTKPTYPYANGKNPSQILVLDLTKL